MMEAEEILHDVIEYLAERRRHGFEIVGDDYWTPGTELFHRYPGAGCLTDLGVVQRAASPRKR